MSVKEEPLFTEPLLCASSCQAPHTLSHLILTMPDETGAQRVNQLVQSHPAPDLNPGLLALASAPTTLLREVLPQPHCPLGAGGWQRGLGHARPACGLLRPWAPDEWLPPLQGLPLRLLVSRLEVGTGRGAGREGSGEVRSSPEKSPCQSFSCRAEAKGRLSVGSGGHRRAEPSRAPSAVVAQGTVGPPCVGQAWRSLLGSGRDMTLTTDCPGLSAASCPRHPSPSARPRGSLGFSMRTSSTAAVVL